MWLNPEVFWSRKQLPQSWQSLSRSLIPTSKGEVCFVSLASTRRNPIISQFLRLFNRDLTKRFSEPWVEHWSNHCFLLHNRNWTSIIMESPFIPVTDESYREQHLSGLVHVRCYIKRYSNVSPKWGRLSISQTKSIYLLYWWFDKFTLIELLKKTWNYW